MVCFAKNFFMKKEKSAEAKKNKKEKAKKKKRVGRNIG